MSSEATQPGNPNAIGNPVHGSISGAGRGSGAPAAAPRRASRIRRWVFSLLAGVRLAAGGGALILMGWSGAEMLRSPLSAPMIEGLWSFAGIFLPFLPSFALGILPVIQMWRSSTRRRGLIIWAIACDFIIISFLVFFLNAWGVDRIFRSGATIPGYIGRLAVGWVFLVIAVMSHLILRLYRPAAQPREEWDGWASWPGAPRLEGAVAEYGRVFNPPAAAPADPQRTWRTAPASRVLNVGMGLVNVVVVAVIALTVPNLINNSFDRFVRITTSAAVSYDGFPTVAEISAAAAGGNQSSADPVWTTASGAVQILAGVRGAVLVTRGGVYGLDSSTGEATWSFTTTDSLKGVDLYMENSAFTSPNGAWLAYAFDVTPDSSLNDVGPREDITRVVVLSTDTGRVSLDTQVTGAVPAVQLTDSNIVINRRVYDIASGRELSPLDDEEIAVSGPGGHSSVIVRSKHEVWGYLRSEMSLDVIPRSGLSDDRSYSSNSRTIEAQVIAGRPVNVSGWVLNPVDDGTVENIDTGETVSLKEDDNPENWGIVGIQASPQAISVWSVQNEVEGQAKDFGHPLSLKVFDTRRGDVTAIDPAGTYRAIEQSSERASYPRTPARWTPPSSRRAWTTTIITTSPIGSLCSRTTPPGRMTDPLTRAVAASPRGSASPCQISEWARTRWRCVRAGSSSPTTPWVETGSSPEGRPSSNSRSRPSSRTGTDVLVGLPLVGGGLVAWWGSWSLWEEFLRVVVSCSSAVRRADVGAVGLVGVVRRVAVWFVGWGARRAVVARRVGRFGGGGDGVRGGGVLGRGRVGLVGECAAPRAR